MNLDKKLHAMHETAFLCSIYYDLKEMAVQIHESDCDDNITIELLAIMKNLRSKICEQE